MSEKTSIAKSTKLASGADIVRNPPANIDEGDDGEFLANREYRTFDTFFRHFENARVSSESLIYKNFVVEKESLYWRKFHRYYQTRHLMKQIVFAKKTLLDRTKHYLLVTDQESTGHFHWLTEVLPRLWLIRERAADLVLLLPDRPYVRTVGMETIELLGLEFQDLVWMQEDQFFTVPSLYHVSKVSQSGTMDDEIMRELRQKFIGDNAKASRSVYISRASAGRRKVLNEHELVGFLSDHEIETLVAEDLSLREQIDLFAQCKTLIGIHGAGLTNCLFMPQGGQVVELMKREPFHAYWNLADSLGHNYYYYYGIPDSDQSLIGTGCNLTIPLDDFDNKILRRIAE